jgi:plastocyanin
MRKARRITIALLVAAIGAWLAVSAVVSSAAMTDHVRIVQNTTTGKYRYKPATLTVHKGDKVVWNNKSNAPHTVTFNTGSYNKTVQPGGAVSRVFKKTGTFKYHCNFHTYMKGTITVT